jgi:hypothetical protein
MVPTFKSKILITDLYSMNPPDSRRGYYFFATLLISAKGKTITSGCIADCDQPHSRGANWEDALGLTSSIISWTVWIPWTTVKNCLFVIKQSIHINIGAARRSRGERRKGDKKAKNLSPDSVTISADKSSRSCSVHLHANELQASKTAAIYEMSWMVNMVGFNTDSFPAYPIGRSGRRMSAHTVDDEPRSDCDTTEYPSSRNPASADTWCSNRTVVAPEWVIRGNP